MVKIPPSVLARDLYACLGDGPGVGSLLLEAVADLEGCETVAQQEVLWSWWIRGVEAYRKDLSEETAQRIVGGEDDLGGVGHS